MMSQRKEDPMRFGKLFCLGLLVAACWVVPGVAQARGGMHGEGLTFSRQLLHALNLTDDQRAHVQEAFRTYRTTVQPLWQEIRTTRQHLQDTLLNPNGLDTGALQTAQQQLTALQADLLQARLTLAQTVHGVLTPAQLTQATHIVEQLRELRAERHQLLTPQTQQP
jgi:Spy/CpxP family protein refolding chaperone